MYHAILFTTVDCPSCLLLGFLVLSQSLPPERAHASPYGSSFWMRHNAECVTSIFRSRTNHVSPLLVYHARLSIMFVVWLPDVFSEPTALEGACFSIWATHELSYTTRSVLLPFSDPEPTVRHAMLSTTLDCPSCLLFGFLLFSQSLPPERAHASPYGRSFWMRHNAECVTSIFRPRTNHVSCRLVYHTRLSIMFVSKVSICARESLLHSWFGVTESSCPRRPV